MTSAADIPRFYIERCDVSGDTYLRTALDETERQTIVAEMRRDPATTSIAVYALQSLEKRETSFKTLL